MTISAEQIVEVASYFTVISHTKGRLRVRVDPNIQNEVENVTIEDIQILPERINGIKKIKVNKMIASVTIEYHHDIFEKRLWDDLISGENSDEVTQIINKLQKEVV